MAYSFPVLHLNCVFVSNTFFWSYAIGVYKIHNYYYKFHMHATNHVTNFVIQ